MVDSHVAKPWDDTIKRLVKANPQHFTRWLIEEEAQFKRSLAIELKNWTLEADVLLEAVLHGKDMGLHIEFQSSDDANMAQRLVEYNVLATREHKIPILSCVFYLRKVSNIAESPLTWELPDGREILEFHFLVVKL